MKNKVLGIAKCLVFAAALIPLGHYLWELRFAFIPEPVEQLQDLSGTWALRFLLLTLLITPLVRSLGWRYFGAFRRMIGLFSFFYICVHFSTWLVLDQNLDAALIINDIAERPYILVGFSAFMLLLPLAVTSTRGMMKRLGRNWKRLHRLIYPAAVLGVMHLLWLVKSDLTKPIVYGLLLFGLLAYRLFHAHRKRSRKRPSAGPKAPAFALHRRRDEHSAQTR